ncbi:chorismate--pyruvate lyase family protein [Guyparkeria sp. TX1]|uniref:chorismate--pyruvate lyase family protein n=1 Tax=Guyparkeria sp. TX1 TaxID=3115001 RepID=UPI003977397A
MSDGRPFALGCFRSVNGPEGGAALFGLPGSVRRLARTTGSFTRALHRHTGRPVVVRRLAEGWRNQKANHWPIPRDTRVWQRRVRLESGEVRVEALTEVAGVNGPITPRLHRAIAGLADTPLMGILERQPLCRRLSFRVRREGRTITRETVYRIHLARVRVTEWFDIDAC